MNREAQLKFCGVCKNRTFNPKHGTICGLTNDLPTFSGICKDYFEDEREIRLQTLSKEKEISETKKTLNKGRYALIIIGGLYLLIGVFEAFFMIGNQLIFGLLDWGIGAVFIGLGIWSFYKPFVALLSGLIFYIALNLLFALIEPMTLFSGLILKFIVLSFLIYSIKVAKNEQSRAQSNDILDQL